MSASLPERSGPVWSRFTADPRHSPDVRASDADRDVAAESINAAFGDGRLDATEHSERLGRALAARKLGELTPLLDDITLPHAKAPRTPAAKMRTVQDGAIRSWIGLAILFNVIWLATWLFAGSAPYYYWPIWPMIGTGIPLLMAWIGAGSAARSREARELEGGASETHAEARERRDRARGRRR